MENGKMLGFMLPEKEKLELIAHADHKGIKLSALLRDIIIAWCAGNKEYLPPQTTTTEPVQQAEPQTETVTQ